MNTLFLARTGVMQISFPKMKCQESTAAISHNLEKFYYASADKKQL
jgi:hypothetical protein